MENSLKGRAKKSKIELATNRYIIIIVLIQVILCLLSALYNCIWVYIKGDRRRRQDKEKEKRRQDKEAEKRRQDKEKERRRQDKERRR